MLGSKEQRLSALQHKADLYIINRENVQWLIEDSGMPFDFDMVVIDEMSSFKNHQSKRFKALRKVRPFVKRIVGLTGTPCSNGLLDLWAQFRLLDKGERLGKRIGQYRDAYFTPDWNGFSYTLRKGAEDEIYHKIADISISMKTTDHLQMPELRDLIQSPPANLGVKLYENQTALGIKVNSHKDSLNTNTFTKL